MVRILTDRPGLARQSANLIMLIEDDGDHAELIIRMAKEHPIPNQVLHFYEGESALDYLFRRNHFCDPVTSPRPQIILIDMHLSDTNGIEILKTIKESDSLRMLPVVMLTTSATESDVAHAYCNHANSYLVKPMGSENFKKLVDILCFYWLGINQRPKIHDAMSETLAFEKSPVSRL